MKHIFLSLLLVLAAAAHAQSTDTFASYADMVGKDVAFYDAQRHIKEMGKFIFVRNEKGKLVAVRETAAFNGLQNGRVMEARAVKTLKSKQYLECALQDETLYFLLSERYPILPYFRSASYWAQKLDELRTRYPYLKANDLEDSAAEVLYGKFVKTEWTGFEMPGHLASEVTFRYLCGRTSVSCAYSQLPQARFATQADVDAEKRRLEEEERKRAEQERRDSIADYELTLAFGAAADNDSDSVILELEGADANLYANYVYAIRGEEALAYRAGEDIRINLRKATFPDSNRKAFLLRRGEKGIENRRLVAQREDSVRMLALQHITDSLLRESKKMREQALNTIRSKQIFIFKDLYSYSSYRFGKKITLFNCFNKRIKYVNITFTNYNSVGDVQRDDLGRHTANVRGIGPIEKNEFGSYDWDELFWDDNDIIRYTHITKITFIFFDGTTKTFSGKANIDKHRAPGCFDDDDE